MYRTKDQVTQEIITEGRRQNITPRGIVIALAVGLVESNLTVYANAKVPGSLALPHDAVGSDGMSVGPFQQQVIMGNGWWWGPVEVCQDPTGSARLFFQRLAGLPYQGTTDTAAGAIAQSIQRSAYPDRYAQRMAEAQAIYDRLANTTGGTPVPAPDPNRPDFNEFAIWSPSTSDRGGKKPTMFLLHTQEGGGGDAAAENLANYLANPANQVSYHYTISQASDGGVTVVDCADTDEASWSVGNANAVSINLCFAGSRASWTREQWLTQAHAIDVAAYLAVQDCRKYGIPTTVIAPPYTGRIPGISDHRYVTKVLGDGTHTDVGDGFPWDVFAAAVAMYAGTAPTEPAAPTVRRFPDDWTDRELLIEVLRQLRGPTLAGWPQLGGRTLVDSVAELRDRS